MTDNDRNTRTLIVAFVIAIMVMIPLRFVEAGQMVGEATVLGESVALESAESGLEAPYNEIEKDGCWQRDEVEARIERILSGVEASEMTREELDQLGVEVSRIESRTCR